MVVRVEENLIVLISDLGVQEVNTCIKQKPIKLIQRKVRPRDIQLCADVTTGVDSHGQYQYHDLVALDQTTVGVIIRLERDHVEILDMFGKVGCLEPLFYLSRFYELNLK